MFYIFFAFFNDYINTETLHLDKTPIYTDSVKRLLRIRVTLVFACNTEEALQNPESVSSLQGKFVIIKGG